MVGSLPAEVLESLKGSVQMGSVEPSAEPLRALAEAGEDDSPVVMLNLLRYREKAAYPEGFEAVPCSGREAYQLAFSVTPIACAIRSVSYPTS